MTIFRYIKLWFMKILGKSKYPTTIHNCQLVADTKAILGELSARYTGAITLEGIYRRRFLDRLMDIQSEIHMMMLENDDESWLIYYPYNARMVLSYSTMLYHSNNLQHIDDKVIRECFSTQLLPTFWPVSYDDLITNRDKNRFVINLLGFNLAKYKAKYGTDITADTLKPIIDRLVNVFGLNGFIQSIMIKYTDTIAEINLILRPSELILDIIDERYGLAWPSLAMIKVLRMLFRRTFIFL